MMSVVLCTRVGVSVWCVVTAVMATFGIAMAQPADDATPLHRAAHAGDAALVDRLLAAGGDADAATRHGVTPLALASARGHAAVVAILLEKWR